MDSRRRETIKLSLVFFWRLFTVAFAIWWFRFSLQHINALEQLQPEQMERWRRQERMLLWEGSTWLVLLISGGAALIALVLKERGRVRRIREFFASFSHEVKTSLASLRVQAESLQDEWQGPASPILGRLIGDTVRLQLQLENSLFLSSQDDLKLYFEWVRLSQLIERMREQWPAVRMDLQGDAVLVGDERALRTIFSNLVKNAVVHGHATEISVNAMVEPATKGRVRVRLHDNGTGFEGALDELGNLFHRPKSTSGSGVGLYICRMLVERMKGELSLHADNHGFRVDLCLGGEWR